MLCLILAGCADLNSMSADLDKVFADDQSEKMIRINNYTDYVDYYLPSDAFELAADALALKVAYGSSSFIMDVNIAGIVNARYYPEALFADEGFFDPARLLYDRNGIYRDIDGNDKTYQYRVYSYDDRYLSCFYSRDLLFYGYASAEDIVPLSSRILIMAKSARVKEDAVIAAYSSKDVIDYEKKQVNMFETVMPVNGNINEFLLNKNDSGDSE